MTKTLRSIATRIRSPKVVAALLLVTTLVALGTSTVANASARRYPDYFGIAKPGSVSTCEGGSWEFRRVWSRHWTWHWGRDWGWFHYKRVWVPSWKKLGFETLVQRCQPPARMTQLLLLGPEELYQALRLTTGIAEVHDVERRAPRARRPD